MTPEEIDQLVSEKVAAAISAYAATQNIGESSRTEKGQETEARNENRGKSLVQHQNKKQKMVGTSNASQNVKRGYTGKLPYCGSCDKHHTGYCTMICDQCEMIEHMTRDYRNPTPVATAMMAKNVEEGCAERKGYMGNHPYCNRCERHHPGHCTVVCKKCKKVGHMTKNCRIAAPMPITAVQMTCYECDEVGHFKKHCPNLKKQTLKQPKEEPM